MTTGALGVRLGEQPKVSVVVHTCRVASSSSRRIIRALARDDRIVGSEHGGVGPVGDLGSQRAIASLFGSTRIFACFSGSRSASNAAGTPANLTDPVSIGDGSTLPCAMR